MDLKAIPAPAHSGVNFRAGECAENMQSLSWWWPLLLPVCPHCALGQCVCWGKMLAGYQGTSWVLLGMAMGNVG
jgi:hypothetical protein